MLGIDTNVLIRFLVGDDADQAAVAQQFIQARCSPEQPAFISVIAAVELFWTLRRTYRFSAEELAATFSGLLRARELLFERPDEVRYAFREFAMNGVDFADALLGAVGEAEGCSTTVTFDQAASRLPMFTLIGE